jgi:hypothetical protein
MRQRGQPPDLPSPEPPVLYQDAGETQYEQRSSKYWYAQTADYQSAADTLVIEARQRFKNIQPGGFPEVIHLRRFAVLNGQPAISRQTLQYFA